VHQADPSRAYGGVGYVHSGDVFAAPGFVDADAADFRLQAGSPCAGKGPRAAVIGPGDGDEATPEEPPVEEAPATESGKGPGAASEAPVGGGGSHDVAGGAPPLATQPNSRHAHRRARRPRRHRHRAHRHRCSH